jgi:NADH-quinone oxidoreductase subunit J
VGIIFLVELVLVVGTWAANPAVLKTGNAAAGGQHVTNTEAIGLVLYTTYIHYFQLAGIVLLVAMIGAIVLTLRHKPQVKRQDIAEQVARAKAKSVEVVQVKPGQGI